MTPELAARMNALNDRFEGHVPWMYLDVKCLVTTGRGNLVDPVSAALPLPWTSRSGVPARQDEIVAEWCRVKSRTDLAPRGGGHFGAITSLRLSHAAIDALCEEKLAAFEGALRGYFADYDSWAEAARVGVLSMAWALGPAFPPAWPHFSAAARAGDWATAARECAIVTVGNPGVAPRNRANAALFNSCAS